MYLRIFITILIPFQHGVSVKLGMKLYYFTRIKSVSIKKFVPQKPLVIDVVKSDSSTLNVTTYSVPLRESK